MQKKKTFVTLFKDIENIHLIKDVGMIPFGMHKFYGYDSKIVIVGEPDEYPYLKTCVEGLDTYCIKAKYERRGINYMLWLIRHAKDIDVLHLFNYSLTSTLWFITIYKRMNKSGMLYIHCDIGEIEYDNINNKFHQFSLLKKIIIKKIVYPKWVQEHILFGVQCQKAVQNLQNRFPFRNVAYIPNGYYNPHALHTTGFDSREDIIVTVGRLGTRQKRTDVLLDGFRKAHDQIPNCRLQLVGSIDVSFQSFLDTWFRENPELKDFVEIKGMITDRKDLEDIYQHAKIFCLTSDYEGFPLTMIEAMACGNALLLTPYNTALEIMELGDYGEVFPFADSDVLAEKMSLLINDQERLRDISKSSVEIVKKKFSYEKILAPVEDWLEAKQYE